MFFVLLFAAMAHLLDAIKRRLSHLVNFLVWLPKVLKFHNL